MAWTDLLKSLTRAPDAYRVGRLIDQRRRENAWPRGARHLVCDIDKTYLETEFESFVRMARIAFEAAADKVTVAGASDVLLAARWGDLTAPFASGVVGEAQTAWPRPLHFVSSSPPQLRAVLEEKLMMDGLDWSSDTFKDQAYNLRMRRMDLLRQHVGYKSLAILRLVVAAGENARFCLIGDNAESDGYVYCGIKLFVEGRLGATAYRAYLEAAGVEPQAAQDLVAEIVIPTGAAVDAILIRNVPGYAFQREAPLTDPVQTFDNFYQAGLLLGVHGIIPPEALWELTRKFLNRHGLSRNYLVATLTPFLAAASEEGGGGLALAEAARAVLAKLGRSQEGEADGGLGASRSVDRGAFRRRDLADFAALTEDRVIERARAWQEKLHPGREAKGGKNQKNAGKLASPSA